MGFAKTGTADSSDGCVRNDLCVDRLEHGECICIFANIPLTFLRLMVLWAPLVMAVIFVGTMIAVWKRDFELPRFWLIAVTFCT